MSVCEFSGCLVESLPESLCAELSLSASTVQFVWGNRGRDMVDKSQAVDKSESYLSLVQGAVSLFLPYIVLYVKEPGRLR